MGWIHSGVSGGFGIGKNMGTRTLHYTPYPGYELGDLGYRQFMIGKNKFHDKIMVLKSCFHGMIFDLKSAYKFNFTRSNCISYTYLRDKSIKYRK